MWFFLMHDTNHHMQHILLLFVCRCSRRSRNNCQKISMIWRQRPRLTWNYPRLENKRRYCCIFFFIIDWIDIIQLLGFDATSISKSVPNSFISSKIVTYSEDSPRIRLPVMLFVVVLWLSFNELVPEFGSMFSEMFVDDRLFVGSSSASFTDTSHLSKPTRNFET